VTIGSGASVDGSVVLDGATIGDFTRVTRSIVGPGAWIGDHCRIEQTAMVGQGARLGSGNTLTAGVRIFPDVDLPDGAIAF
jgi:mannose-1-phosphate guanylyltransferase